MEMPIVQLIQGMLAPGLMISACGLLLLGMNNKYSLVVNRIRLLTEEKRRIFHQDRIDEIATCYESQLFEHPDMTGMVSIKFIISGNGTMQMAAGANSSLGNTQVAYCILNEVMEFVYPQPEAQIHRGWIQFPDAGTQ